MSQYQLSKEDEFLIKRFIDLSKTAYHKEVPVFSDFLSLYEVDLFHQYSKELSRSTIKIHGGYIGAERCVIGFFPDYITLDQFEGTYFPIDCILIQPSNAKFSQTLSHRDFLGTLIGLGLDRSVIGDIIVKDDCAYVFVKRDITPYICDNLTRIKHTTVNAMKMDIQLDAITPKKQVVKGSVSSFRLDAIIALGFNLSRSLVVGYIQGKKVFVNGRCIENNSYPLKENDIISVRGQGKIQFIELITHTKKGRMMVIIHRYI